ncbi:MAG TPA: hypothetical protein VKE98_22530 [Gemmataceae bacterium]|nr:hypothetical protein [Gemmataceae bacterium]
MKHRIVVGALALAALAVTSGWGDEPLKSGPQVGAKGAIVPFHPLHCSGPAEGKKVCLV